MSSETPTLSFSALTTYEKCPEKYRKKFLEKDKGIQLPRDYFLIGRLAHKIVEYILKENTSLSDAYTLALPVWLQEMGFDIESDFGSGLYGQLFKYAWEFGQLLHRASPTYLKEDRIRKKDGSVLSDAYKFPSKDLKKEYEDLDLDILRQDIDDEISRRYQYYTLLSISDCAAQGLSYAANFQTPDWVKETVATELALDVTDKIGNNEWRMIGYIDWLVKTVDDDFMIVDFKTGKSKPTQDEVLWNPQLILYTLLYYIQFSEPVSCAAIYHLPSGQIEPVEISNKIVEDILDHYGRMADRIKDQQFHKRFPTEFNSPCVDRDFKTKDVKGICPYLDQCWPKYINDIQDEEVVRAIREIKNDDRSRYST
jgi:ATP-dependent helicase/DNAse subunit B